MSASWHVAEPRDVSAQHPSYFYFRWTEAKTRLCYIERGDYRPVYQPLVRRFEHSQPTITWYSSTSHASSSPAPSMTSPVTGMGTQRPGRRRSTRVEYLRARHSNNPFMHRDWVEQLPVWRYGGNTSSGMRSHRDVMWHCHAPPSSSWRRRNSFRRNRRRRCCRRRFLPCLSRPSFSASRRLRRPPSWDRKLISTSGSWAGRRWIWEGCWFVGRLDGSRGSRLSLSHSTSCGTGGQRTVSSGVEFSREFEISRDFDDISSGDEISRGSARLETADTTAISVRIPTDRSSAKWQQFVRHFAPPASILKTGNSITLRGPKSPAKSLSKSAATETKCLSVARCSHTEVWCKTRPIFELYWTGST